MTLSRKRLSSLKVSPENESLYGEINPNDPDVRRLAESIRRNGVREPFAVTRDHYIASGNRRFTACKLIGQVKVPVESPARVGR